LPKSSVIASSLRICLSRATWARNRIGGSSGIGKTLTAGGQLRTSCGTLNSAADEAALSRRARRRSRTRAGVQLVRGACVWSGEGVHARGARFDGRWCAGSVRGLLHRRARPDRGAGGDPHTSASASLVVAPLRPYRLVQPTNASAGGRRPRPSLPVGVWTIGFHGSFAADQQFVRPLPTYSRTLSGTCQDDRCPPYSWC